MRRARDDVESGEKRSSVQRSRNLAGAAADAIDELAFRDDGRDLVAVGFVTRSDGLVEVEHLAGHQHRAVEVRRCLPQVVGARVVFGIFGVAGVEPAEDLVEFDVAELRCDDARLHGVHGGGHGALALANRGVEACERPVDVQAEAQALRTKDPLLEIDDRIRGGLVELVFNRDECVHRALRRHAQRHR